MRCHFGNVFVGFRESVRVCARGVPIDSGWEMECESHRSSCRIFGIAPGPASSVRLLADGFKSVEPLAWESQFMIQSTERLKGEMVTYIQSPSSVQHRLRTRTHAHLAERIPQADARRVNKRNPCFITTGCSD